MRLSVLLIVFGLLWACAMQAQETRIAVIGLRHGHAWGHLPKMVEGKPAKLVGVSETSQELLAEAKKAGVPDNIVFTDYKQMLAAAKPDIVWTFVENNRHREIVEACAARKIHVMLEKPLASTYADALAIREAARKSGIQVLTNYQMAWWAANYVAKKQVDEGALGPIWRIHAIIGHGGPGGGNVRNQYFLDWLTDPVKNGGGALVDFGCYGAIWSLWFMGKPETVMAQTNQIQPERFPKVDDNATIVLHYKSGVAVLEGSWDLPASFQDLEIFSRSGIINVRRDAVELRKGRGEPTKLKVDDLPEERSEPITYMAQAVRSGKPLDGIVALDINVDAVEILEAARTSLNTGKIVRLPLK
jgi:predicted dehydrogenase